MLKSPYLAMYFAFLLGLAQAIALLVSGEPVDAPTPFILISVFFGLVGMSVERLQNETRDMQKQIEELKSQRPDTNDEADK